MRIISVNFIPMKNGFFSNHKFDISDEIKKKHFFVSQNDFFYK